MHTCAHCGAALDVGDGSSVFVTCPSCGTTSLRPADAVPALATRADVEAQVVEPAPLAGETAVETLARFVGAPAAEPAHHDTDAPPAELEQSDAAPLTEEEVEEQEEIAEETAAIEQAAGEASERAGEAEAEPPTAEPAS